MKTSKFSDEQIAMALRQAEAGTPARSAASWGSASRVSIAGRSASGPWGVSELRELCRLLEENRKLKGLVADLSLDKTILHEALRKKW